jgi:hypothetical protein
LTNPESGPFSRSAAPRFEGSQLAFGLLPGFQFVQRPSKVILGNRIA